MESDGVYWLSGFKMGRVSIYNDRRWIWAGWCRPLRCGLVATKEEAKAAVEAQATLDAMTAAVTP